MRSTRCYVGCDKDLTGLPNLSGLVWTQRRGTGTRRPDCEECSEVVGMSANWQTVKLKDLAEVIMGQSPRSEYYNTEGIGLPFFQGCGEFGQLRPTVKKYCSKPTRIAQEGDVLMSVRAPIGTLNIADRECCIGRGLCAIRSKKGSRFVYYLLKANLALIQTYGSGTTFRAINKAEVNNLPLEVPPLPTQRKIAAILSAYDDLIENNTRRIAILQEMTQALYREWFVHFRFPGHEQVAMVDSELGLIPEGWEIGRLDDALVLQRGFDLPRKKRRLGNVPVYAATGVTDTHDEARIKAPGVVTGRSGSLGTVMYVEDDFWPLNTTLWVREFRHATPLYAYYLLNDMRLENYNSGAAVPTLNRNDIHGLPVVLPPAGILEEFDDHALPLFAMRKLLRERNETLRCTRDLLLPRLISGEVDVSDLEINTGGLDQ